MIAVVTHKERDGQDRRHADEGCSSESKQWATRVHLLNVHDDFGSCASKKQVVTAHHSGDSCERQGFDTTPETFDPVARSVQLGSIYKYFNYRMILSDDAVRNGNGQFDQLWIISVAKNVTGTPLLTRSQQCSFSDGSRTRQMCVYADNPHDISHLQSARRFQTTLVLLGEHGRVHSTRVFQNSCFNKYTEHQIRSSHGSRARPGLHTVCVRKPSDFALLRVRGPNRGINSHASTWADTNLFLAEFTKRGWCDNQQSGTQHQWRIQHDTTRDVTPDEER